MVFMSDLLFDENSCLSDLLFDEKEITVVNPEMEGGSCSYCSGEFFL
jgi:hypothetical protein